MNKKRLLIWGDAPTALSGFGRVTKNLIEYLYQTFDIAILGINYTGMSKYDTSKYFMYPTTSEDKLGINRFEFVFNDFKPEVILFFQDIFNIYHLLQKHQVPIKEAGVPYVIYFPVDGTPFSRIWKDTILSASKVVTYTEWARDTIRESNPSLKDMNIDVVYHGVEETFYPLPNSQIKNLRRDFGWSEKFIITNVNRFQPRKYIAQTLRIASMFIKGYKECLCGNIYPTHLDKCDLNNCPSSNVLNKVDGHKDAALYLHMNLIEAMQGTTPSDFLTSIALNSGFDKDDNNKFIFFNGRQVYGPDATTDTELNQLYNASNVLLSTSLGEGFGLSTLEALATGTPAIVGKHSANFELTDNGKFGYLVDNQALISLGRDSGHLRPIMNTQKALIILNELYLKFEGKKLVMKELSDYAKEKFSWSIEGNKMKTILESV